MITRALFTLLFIVLVVMLPGRESASGQGVRTVRGQVADSTDHSGIPYATIAVISGDGKIRKATASDAKGGFFLALDPAIDQSIQVTSVGYHKKTIPLVQPFPAAGFLVFLIADRNVLKEVNVGGRKPLVKQDIDRLSYSVKDDPERKRSTTFEILRKVPLVSISSKEEVMVNGKQNYRILLNGKPSAILSGDPAFVLGNIPADQVDRIEVVTTPASRYTQNGIAEVINIITFNKNWAGFQANIREVANTQNYSSTNATGEYKYGKWGLTAYGSYLTSSPPVTMISNRITPLGRTGTVTVQNGSLTPVSNSLSATQEISYESDSLNLFLTSIALGGNNGTNRQWMNTERTNLTDLTRTIGELATNSERRGRNLSFNFYYEHQGRKNRERVFTLGYKYTRPERSVTDSISRSDAGSVNRSFQENSTVSAEHTIQADYSHPVRALTIDAGIKQVLRNNSAKGGAFLFDGLSGGYVPDPAASTDQHNLQNVLSIYHSYYLKKKSWGIRAALRYEGTDLDHQLWLNNFIPSANLQYRINSAILAFNYDQEIGRPAIWQLNTFRNNVNPNFVVLGNPDLRTSVLHRFDLSYSLAKGNFYRFSFYTEFTNNGINGITTLINDTTTVMTYQNLGKKTETGLRYSVSYQISKQLDLNFSGRLSRVSFDNIIAGRRAQNQGVEFFFTNDLSYLLNKTWRFSWYCRVSNPYYGPQGRGFWWIDNSLSVNRKFFKGRLNTTFSVENPFTKTRRNVLTTETFDLSSIKISENQIRQVNLSLSYKFGGLKAQIKKNKKRIENTDLKPETSN